MRLHVGGLNPSLVDERELSNRFTSLGAKVISATLIRDTQTGEGKGFGFIEIDATTQIVNRCLSLLNGTKWMGYTLHIEPAKPDFEERRRMEMEKVALSEQQTAEETVDHKEEESSEPPQIEGSVVDYQKLCEQRFRGLEIRSCFYENYSTEYNLKKARSRGWKLRKISLTPRPPGLSHKIFREREEDPGDRWGVGERKSESEENKSSTPVLKEKRSQRPENKVLPPSSTQRADGVIAAEDWLGQDDPDVNLDIQIGEKKIYEGSDAKHMMELQSSIGIDPRFRMTAAFSNDFDPRKQAKPFLEEKEEEEEENSSDKAGESQEESISLADEKRSYFNVLQGMFSDIGEMQDVSAAVIQPGHQKKAPGELLLEQPGDPSNKKYFVTKSWKKIMLDQQSDFSLLPEEMSESAANLPLISDMPPPSSQSIKRIDENFFSAVVGDKKGEQTVQQSQQEQDPRFKKTVPFFVFLYPKAQRREDLPTKSDERDGGMTEGTTPKDISDFSMGKDFKRLNSLYDFSLFL